MSTALHFDTPFSFEKSIHVLEEVIATLGGDSDVTRLLASRDWAGLVGLDVNYADPAADSVSIRNRRQALAFFSKNASIPLGLDTSAVALQKFRESEEKCRATNNRFRNRSLPFSQGGLDAALIFNVQRKISAILGPLPGLDSFNFGFGPGANVGQSRFTSVRRKISARPTCTAAARKYIPYLRENFPFWESLSTTMTTDYGKFATVPKNAKTDRSILVEPIVNSFLQKGVGNYIRERLLKFGIDLTDQSRNQELARVGSLSGRYATLDLSSASDTISREVVAELLPLDWWMLLDDLRSPHVRFPDGQLAILQKFSSMGNGFTFELESLIFFAICSVTAGKDVSVYGDDIIVRTEFADRTIRGLEHFGFSLNLEKSFSSGPFRESCGKDFFNGSNVRPCYVKGLLSVKEVVRLHNFFIRSGEEGLAACLVKHIPGRFRVYGPDGYGDGHLLGDHPTRPSGKHKKRGWSGYLFRTHVTVPNERTEALSGDYAAFLYLTTGSKSESGYVGDEFRPRRSTHMPWESSFEVPGDIPQPSRSMYYERGSKRYRLRNVYCLG